MLSSFPTSDQQHPRKMVMVTSVGVGRGSQLRAISVLAMVCVLPRRVNAGHMCHTARNCADCTTLVCGTYCRNQFCTPPPTRPPTQPPTVPPTRAPSTFRPSMSPTAPTLAPITSSPTFNPSLFPTLALRAGMPCDFDSQCASTMCRESFPVTGRRTCCLVNSLQCIACDGVSGRCQLCHFGYYMNSSSGGCMLPQPTNAPTISPFLSAPTRTPMTRFPTRSPVGSPIITTFEPSISWPAQQPWTPPTTRAPTNIPTYLLTTGLTASPTGSPGSNQQLTSTEKDDETDGATLLIIIGAALGFLIIVVLVVVVKFAREARRPTAIPKLGTNASEQNVAAQAEKSPEKVDFVTPDKAFLGTRHDQVVQNPMEDEDYDTVVQAAPEEPHAKVEYLLPNQAFRGMNHSQNPIEHDDYDAVVQTPYDTVVRADFAIYSDPPNIDSSI